MPRLRKPPTYRLHKASGNAVVTILGKDHYLGVYGSAKSREAYAKLISSPPSSDVPPSPAPSMPSGAASIVELLAAFWQYAVEYYVDAAGHSSTEQQNYRVLLKRLRTFCVGLRIDEFGPNRFREFRETLIEADLARTNINNQMRRVRILFKWGVGREIVPPSVLQSLQAVEPLRFGKTKARETAAVKTVPHDWILSVMKYCPPQIAAMIEVQSLTGMRSGEITIMRTRDIGMTNRVWEYRPTTHKTLYRGHERVIFIGPRAQKILRPWLRADGDEYLFSPSEVDAWRRLRLHEMRKTPLSCGNRPGTNRCEDPQKRPGDRYDSRSYHRAIVGALEKCNRDRLKQEKTPIYWHPHQLRHNAATRLNAEFGIETARVVLGHKSVVVTQTYAEADMQRAAAAMGKLG